MLRLFSFSITFVILVVACRPNKKEELKTVEPPAVTQQDTFIAPTLTRLWETDKKLTTAESVFYDTIGSVLFVSCINGVPPDKKDEDGFIAKVGLDGKIITLKWATGLSAPKGMGRIGETLYVTDIDRLVAIDVDTGKISNTWEVSGASFLNDIATSDQAIVYISDSNTSTIYELVKGKVTVMMADTTLQGTNGLFVDGKNLLIAGDGASWTVVIDGHSVTKLAEGIPAGDGIERYGAGIFQSSGMGEIYFIKSDGTFTKVLDTKDVKLNAADIEVIENKNLMFVPTFFGNSVTAYTIK